MIETNLISEVKATGIRPLDSIKALNDVRRTADIRLIRVGALFMSALGIALAESLSIGLLYPALAYLEKGPRHYLESLPTAIRVLVKWLEYMGVEVALGALLLLALMPVLFRLVMQVCRDVLVASIVHQAISNLRSKVYEAILKADLNFHRHSPSARLHAAMVNQVNGAARLIPELGLIAAGGVQIGLFFSLLLVVSAPMAVITSVFLLLLAAVYRFFFRPGADLGDEQVKGYFELKARTIDTLNNARLIKMYGMEDDAVLTLGSSLQRIFKADFRINLYSAVIEAVTLCLFSVSALALFYVAATYFAMPLAAIGLFMMVLLRMQPVVSTIGRSFFNIITGNKAWLETARLLREAGDARESYGGRLRSVRMARALEFDHVSYSYRSQDREVAALRDICITIPKGQIVGIVGKSGAGKSTLVDMIPRFLEPDTGQIMIDGVSTREFDLQSLRESVGFVPQEPLMFDDTIRANLAYGLRDIADADIFAALRAAHGTDILSTMRSSLDTLVGERGARLSGGQRQRLALARAILAGNSILVLDEPTNALDVQSEIGIRAALEELRGHTTILLIAHRLDTVRIADRILVMQEGRIVDDGTLSDLAARNGYFRALFDLEKAA
jgi:subfamily B ATP-binding cassette protein MsbA